MKEALCREAKKANQKLKESPFPQPHPFLFEERVRLVNMSARCNYFQMGFRYQLHGKTSAGYHAASRYEGEGSFHAFGLNRKTKSLLNLILIKLRKS